MFKEFGSDKDSTHSYDEVYHRLLDRYVGRNAKLLEIGVQHGGSMLAWKKYLINAEITGIDKDPHTPIGDYEFMQIDITNKDLFTEKMKGRSFDIIIDDGSHYVEDQLLTIEVLINNLADNGVYVIEDFVYPEQWVRFKKFGAVELIDLRYKKGRYDDSLVVVKKPIEIGGFKYV